MQLSTKLTMPKLGLYNMTLNNTVEGMRQKKTGGAKEYIYYNNTDQPLWTFRVPGSFEYDGNSVEAIDADYSQSVHVSF